MNMRWQIATCPERLKEELSDHLGVPPLIAHLLINRGIERLDDASTFLWPSLRQLHDPMLLTDMDKAVTRIIKAIKQRELITVYGDFDADGITSCALLVDFVRTLGLAPAYYVPQRLSEGYGLNPDAITKIAGNGSKLMLCVDCGVSDHDEIHLARQLGMDVIVIDHHEPPPVLPPANAVLDPLRSDCNFPFKGLAGVGVALYLLVALRAELRAQDFWSGKDEPNLLRYLDLVALGTIADIVPLLDTNRIFVTYGLRELQHTRRPGLVALKELSGMGNGPLLTDHVAFRLAPRLNAAGRLSDAATAVDLLLAPTYEHAYPLASVLEQANRERQALQETILDEARAMIGQLPSQDRSSYVLASDRWHPGVIGIVASRLADDLLCPVVLVALDTEQGRGSARGIPGLNLYRALEACEHHLVRFGGHRGAAGLTLSRNELAAFTDTFETAIRQQLHDHTPVSALAIDAEIDLCEITPELLKSLALLEPHGTGNPRPLFSSRKKVCLDNLRLVGKNSLKCTAREGAAIYDSIGFGMGSFCAECPAMAKIAFCPQLNTWNGVTSLQLELQAVDIPSGG
jgi:single-stranded-DNA-specific exonuclease